MKRGILAFSNGILILSFLCLFFACKNIDNKDDQTSQSFILFKDTTEPDAEVRKKQVIYQDHTENIIYTSTETATSIAVSSVSKELLYYKTEIDVFSDLAENEYLFIKETDSFCGFAKKNFYKKYLEGEQCVPEETAITTAETYLNLYISDFKQYDRIACQYSKSDGYYQMQYCRPLNGILTDDIITVFIQADGQLGAFTAFKHGAYHDIHISEEAIAQARQAAASITDPLMYEYITSSEEGIILLQYHEVSENGYSRAVPSAFVLQPAQ